MGMGNGTGVCVWGSFAAHTHTQRLSPTDVAITGFLLQSIAHFSLLQHSIFDLELYFLYAALTLGLTHTLACLARDLRGIIKYF